MTRPLTRLIIIAVILLGVLAYWLVRRLRAKRSNDTLVEKLAAPPVEAPPDDLSAQDVKAMEERAAKALEIMRGQRVGPTKDLVYELPWYVIIGPRGRERPPLSTTAASTSPWLRNSARRRCAGSAAHARRTGGSLTAPC